MFGKDIGERIKSIGKIVAVVGLVVGALMIILPLVAAILTASGFTADRGILGIILSFNPYNNWTDIAIKALSIAFCSYVSGLIIAGFGEHVRCQTALVDAAEQKQTIVLKEKIIQQPPEMHAVPTRFTEEPKQVKTPAKAEPILEPVASDTPKDGHPTINIEDTPKVDFSRRNVEPTAVMEHDNQVMKQENETLLKQIKVLEAEKEELVQKLSEKNN